MPRSLLRAIALAGLVSGLTASAQAVTFDPGSLVIPMQTSFQSDCGMVSAYGLVYRILLSNAPGHANATAPVTVFIALNETKGSHNHCIPAYTGTSLATLTRVPYATGTPVAGYVNDGCDFSISNITRQPVVPFTTAVAWPASGIFNDAAVPTFHSRATASVSAIPAWPQYNWGSAPWSSLTTTNRFAQVSYEGGAFVISAADARKVYDLLRLGDNGLLPMNQFQQYTTACACGSITSAMPPSTPTPATPVASMGCHQVSIHQTTTTFTTNVARQMSDSPVPFILYDPDYPVLDSRRHTGGSPYVLERYISIAGLNLTGTANHMDSKGCAYGNVSGCTYNGSAAGPVGTPNVSASVYHGVIFDLFTTPDLDFAGGAFPQGLMNYRTGLSLFYRLFWAPHWEGHNGPTGAGPTNYDDRVGLTGLVNFNNSGGNILGECASTQTWENASPGRVGIGGPTVGTNFLFTNGMNYDKLGNYTNTTGGGLGHPALAPDAPGSGTPLTSCADPGATAQCVTYSNVTDVFSQVGDWTYDLNQGYVDFFAASTAPASVRRAYTEPLVAVGGYDVFDKAQQDSQHGVIVYVGGHDVSADPQGSRIVLNSMLNLSSRPLSSERALAAPVVVYQAPGGVAQDELVSPTYDAVTGYGTNSAVKNFTYAQPDVFVFPYYPGHLRTNGLSGGTVVAAGEGSFASGQLWNSDVLSNAVNAPGQRNLFTYVGGYPKPNPSLDGLRSAPNSVLQVGWVPEKVDGRALSLSAQSVGGSASGCVDVMGFSTAVAAPTYDDGQAHPHLVIGADGLCDAQQLAPLSSYSSVPGSFTAASPDWTAYQADAPKVQLLYQFARGFCHSASTLTPASSAACVDTTNDDLYHLGGLVHSTPAVEVPSQVIPNSGGSRPTVAYVGGYDGQFHAFYLGGGANYTGPAGWTASSVNFPYGSASADRDAHNKFNHDFAAEFAAGTVPPPGTELWSFIPATQLASFKNNGAQVDSSAVIQDVFADFAGSGLREWHTVVVGSVGPGGNELFAIDVTNPLKPRLLWDIVGSEDSTTGAQYSGTVLLNDRLGAGARLPGAQVSARWSDGSVYSVGAPEARTKAYDYQDLGGSTSMVLSQIRLGVEPFYVVYVATAMTKTAASLGQSGTSGRRGIEVFAIEASTGQKLWQWEHDYTSTAQPPSTALPPDNNSAPPQVSVVYGQKGTSRLLVGDQQGRVWELDAATGVNVNTSTTLPGCSTAAPCAFAAVDTVSTAAAPQPVSTNIAVVKVPPNATGPLAGYAGFTVMVFGTGGEDWIYTGAPTTKGKLHVVLYDTLRRNLGSALAVDKTAIASSGVLTEPAGFPLIMPAGGETIYGTITISGQTAFFSTATQPVGNNIMGINALTGGHLYSVDLGGAATLVQQTSTLANYGGVAVYAPTSGANAGQVAVLGLEVSKLNRVNLSGTAQTAAQTNPALSNANSTLYWLRNWVRRFLP